jgi:hypothetical protein
MHTWDAKTGETCTQCFLWKGGLSVAKPGCRPKGDIQGHRFSGPYCCYCGVTRESYAGDAVSKGYTQCAVAAVRHNFQAATQTVAPPAPATPPAQAQAPAWPHQWHTNGTCTRCFHSATSGSAQASCNQKMFYMFHDFRVSSSCTHCAMTRDQLVTTWQICVKGKMMALTAPAVPPQAPPQSTAVRLTLRPVVGQPLTAVPMQMPGLSGKIHKITYDKPAGKKCECGAASIGWNRHSHWCPLKE